MLYEVITEEIVNLDGDIPVYTFDQLADIVSVIESIIYDAREKYRRLCI